MHEILRSLLKIGLTAIVITIAVIGTIRLIGNPAISVNQVSTQKNSTFDVTGQSQMAVVPDKAEVRLGIVVNKPTVAEAQGEINRISTAITDQLVALGIEKKYIKTADYSINPDYRYEPTALNRIVGYNANSTVVVEIRNFELLNQAIDKATTTGANSVGGISFGLTEETQKKVEEAARVEAVEEAKTKAESLAKIAGIRLGKVINVQENAGAQPPVIYADAMKMSQAGGGGAPTELEPGTSMFNYSVTLSYETE
jgi:uncharacterized protein